MVNRKFAAGRIGHFLEAWRGRGLADQEWVVLRYSERSDRAIRRAVDAFCAPDGVRSLAIRNRPIHFLSSCLNAGLVDSPVSSDLMFWGVSGEAIMNST